jgi:hypothetical protein
VARPSRPARLALLPILAAAVVSILGTAPAVAQTAPICVVEIGGHSLALADRPELAIPVDAHSSVLVVGGSAVPVTSVDVAISVWPFPPALIALDPPEPTQLWAGELPVAEYSRFGAGLYQVAATTDVADCAVRGWVNVTGRSPLETPVGWVGLGLVAIGVVVALRAVFSRRTGGLVAIVGGVITGLGLLLLAQQAGLHAITPQSALVWTVVPGAIAGAANAIAGAFTSAAPAGAGAGAGGAAATTPTVAPPTAPTPPPAAPAGPTSPNSPPVGTSPGGAGPTAVGAGSVASGSGAAAAAGGTAAGPSGPAAGATGEDPPRTTYARLTSPDAVVVNTVFDVVVGLADRPDPRVVGEAMTRPPTSVGAYTITIQLVADGMRLAERSGTWRLDLPVTSAEPYPVAAVPSVSPSVRWRSSARPTSSSTRPPPLRRRPGSTCRCRPGTLRRT